MEILNEATRAAMKKNHPLAVFEAVTNANVPGYSVEINLKGQFAKLLVGRVISGNPIYSNQVYGNEAQTKQAIKQVYDKFDEIMGRGGVRAARASISETQLNQLATLFSTYSPRDVRGVPVSEKSRRLAGIDTTSAGDTPGHFDWPQVRSWKMSIPRTPNGGTATYQFRASTYFTVNASFVWDARSDDIRPVVTILLPNGATYDRDFLDVGGNFRTGDYGKIQDALEGSVKYLNNIVGIIDDAKKRLFNDGFLIELLFQGKAGGKNIGVIEAVSKGLNIQKRQMADYMRKALH